MSHVSLDHMDHWGCATVLNAGSLLQVSCYLGMRALVDTLVEGKVQGIVLHKVMVLEALNLPNQEVVAEAIPAVAEGTEHLLQEDMQDMQIEDHSQGQVEVNVRARMLLEDSGPHRSCSSVSCSEEDRDLSRLVAEEVHSLVDSSYGRTLLVGMVAQDMVLVDRHILVVEDSRP